MSTTTHEDAITRAGALDRAAAIRADRRARGVFYTPRYIVDAVVARALDPFVKDKTPEELIQVRIVDPACGTGHFVCGAFEHLVRAHERFYVEVAARPGHYAGDFCARDGAVRLTLRRKQEILAKCMYGVDIDGPAVDIARTALRERLLEREVEGELERASERDEQATISRILERQVRHGDSLLSPQELAPPGESGEAPVALAFDWRSLSEGFGHVMAAGGFHAVVGNPPYVRIQAMRAGAPRAVALYKSRYRAAKSGSFDLYGLFVERALGLIRPEGRVGYIVPHKFFQAKYGEALRDLLAEKRAVREIVDLGHAQAFEGATTYTCLLFLGGSPSDKVEVRRVDPASPGGLARGLIEALDRPAETVAANTLARATWDLSSEPRFSALAERLCARFPPLRDVCERIFQGLVTGADDVFFLEERGRRAYSRALDAEVDVEAELLHPLLKGAAHIRRYAADKTPLRALFPYRSAGARAELLSPGELRLKYPGAWAYLEACKPILERRERGAWRGRERWYAYGRSQALSLVNRPKIMCPSLAKRTSFVVDAAGEMFFSGSGGGGGGGYGLRVRPGVSMDYVCALLNSSLLDGLLRARSTVYRGGYMASNRQYIERLPIRLLDPTQPDEKAAHDAIVELAQRAAVIHARLREALVSDRAREALLAERTSIDEAIDVHVDRLYGIAGGDAT
jgi:hypothetical protein